MAIADDRSDAVLLAATATDPEAFGVFYRRHVRAVLTYLLARTHRPELAADLCAEVFATALEHRERFDVRRGPARAWLLNMVGSRLVDSVRRGQVEDRARRRLGMAPRSLTDHDLERIEELGTHTGGVDASVLVEDLPEDQREAVLARVVHERDYSDIAAELEIGLRRGRMAPPSCLMLTVSTQARTVEQILAEIARDQHGVVAREQLSAAGVSPAEISWRVGTGALIREFRAVYRVGHKAPSVEAGYMAAVLACGADARLCGLAAGHLLSLVRGRPPAPEVESPRERHVEGIVTRRSRAAPDGDGIVWQGIPVTTVARTLVDLARVLSRDELARACHEAQVRHRTTAAEVEVVLARRPNSRGTGDLRAVLRGEIRVSLSKLERRFLTVLTHAGLPLPQTNRVAGTHRVDCRWPEHRLTVELDSYRYHHSRYAWEQDRHREREAHARGDDFRRYTWGDVCEDPRQMLAELRALLAHRPG